MYKRLFLLSMGFVILDVNPVLVEKDQYVMPMSVGSAQTEGIIVLDAKPSLQWEGYHTNFQRWKEKIIQLINVVIEFMKKLFDLLRLFVLV